MSGYFADASGTEKDDARGENPFDDAPRTIPGTADDYSRCDYDELCEEAREGIDAILSAHTAGAMREPVALMLLRFLGMCDYAAKDLLAAERFEASQP